MEPDVRVHDGPTALVEAAANLVLESARDAVRERGRFVWGLAGGSTPRALYEALVAPPYADAMPWAATHIFWGDERWVPADAADSNQRMAREALLGAVSPASVVPILTEDLAPDESAAAAEAGLRGVFGGEPPRPDLLLLGIGSDGHTASIFPSAPPHNSPSFPRRREPRPYRTRRPLYRHSRLRGNLASPSPYKERVGRVRRRDGRASAEFTSPYKGRGRREAAGEGTAGAGAPAAERLFAANWVPQLGAWRITATFRLIRASRRVVFLAQGRDKAEPVGKAQRPIPGEAPVPAALAAPEGGAATWLLDREAAGETGETGAGAAGGSARAGVQ